MPPRLVLAAVVAAVLCSSCATVQPPDYRHGAAVVTLPAGWEKAPAPSKNHFAATEESGDGLSVLVIGSLRPSASSEGFGKETWERVLRYSTEGVVDGLKPQAEGGRVKRMETEFQWNPERPGYFSRFEFESVTDGVRTRESYSSLAIASGGKMYNIGLLEPKRRHDADPNRFERIVATLRFAK